MVQPRTPSLSNMQEGFAAVGEVNGLTALTDAYRHNSMPKMDLARVMRAYREKEGISQQEMARRMGITPGVVHHHESIASLAPSLIAAVEAGKLRFKEARSLADLRRGSEVVRYGKHRVVYAPDHERQIEIAQPFLDKRLSSVFIEAAVRIAKARPELPVDEVIVLVLAKSKVKPKNWRPAPALRVATVMTEADEVTRRMLDLAALLTPLASTPYCDVVTMRLRQTARILSDRLQAARLV